MKKLFVILNMMFFIVCSSHAQQGIQSAGAHISYGTQIESVGIGVKYQYNITNEIRLEPSANYYFEKDNVDMWDINLNAHYLFPVASNIRIYPLVGLTYTNWGWDLGKVEGWEVDGSKSKFGVNLGGGADFDIADNWMLNFEIKYQLISDFDQAVFNFGVAYIF